MFTKDSFTVFIPLPVSYEVYNNYGDHHNFIVPIYLLLGHTIKNIKSKGPLRPQISKGNIHVKNFQVLKNNLRYNWRHHRK